MIIKRIRNCQQGMTYVELIVVLGIFSVLSTVVIFNYGDFQAKVDIKNLGSDIALRIVEAQKSALAGLLPPLTQQFLIPPPASTWKPSYGVYFNLNPISENKSFIYFTDVNSDHLYTDPDCDGNGECLNKTNITKNNFISNLYVFEPNTSIPIPLDDLSITFSRPNSGADIRSSTHFVLPVSYAQISIESPSGVMSSIKVYPSGRVQVN